MSRRPAPAARSHDPLARHRVPPPPPGLAAKVLAAAAEAAAADEHQDWAARLWASTAARMLWAATICALLLGHTLANRPLPLASVAEDSAPVRALAAVLELPAQSLITIASAIRRLPAREMDVAASARASQLERMLEETGG